ncbi:hypothetical protein [Paracoccus sp. PAMC 22219]|uniref:hypothetical protein n=1 Tax=Paracoccus sp. PAMC 22219 TaxID=1569209 RepID=UPI0005AB6004|nr:hypothetical protein [Paracoccus sp. PAMC 22219]
MTRRRSQLNARLGALSITAFLIATQAAAQTSGGGLPTAQDIWRHLPPCPVKPPNPRRCLRPRCRRPPDLSVRLRRYPRQAHLSPRPL